MYRAYNEAVRDELKKIQGSGGDLSKWTKSDAAKFVEQIRGSNNPRIGPYLRRIDEWLDSIASIGIPIYNRGISGLPSLRWYRRCGRWVGELAKPLKILAIPFVVVAAADDAQAYGPGVAIVNAVNPIPFVDLQDVVDIEPDLPPLEPPMEVVADGFIGPLATWQARP